MGRTITEKIIGRAAGKDVRAGEIVWAHPDLVTAPDMTGALFFRQLKELGITKVWDRDRLLVAIDHCVLFDAEKSAERNHALRGFVKDFGITNFFDVGGNGVGHQIFVEKGLIRPGQLVTATDTHGTTMGAVGAAVIPVLNDGVTVMATGRVWLRVPTTIRVELSGHLRKGVMSRDVILHVLARVGPEKGDYRAFEFGGPAIADLDMDARMTLCNGVVEIGGKVGIVPPDGVTMAYLKDRASGDLNSETGDQDAEYEAVLPVDLDSLEPRVAVPPSPHLAVEVSELESRRIDQAFVGSCAGGRIEDLRAAVEILRGRKVDRGVRMVLTPASQEVYLAALREGLVETLVSAGALVTHAACGPCIGFLAPLAAGEVCIGTGTRNEPGRMGSEEATVYLASAATVAASAVEGRIVDPRSLL